MALWGHYPLATLYIHKDRHRLEFSVGNPQIHMTRVAGAHWGEGWGGGILKARLSKKLQWKWQMKHHGLYETED